ncbi:hypothetical protein BTUL_0071g00410 [Botrytis tulipae]|uniref:Uncharacterized protein n=1 Tax=Botrytis tulipae TaxID=87230 RepID=A0A4Z1ESA9_9HELO|nr:hypothetical protein BTUL_0071g00410 [Botrytis tulipae]
MSALDKAKALGKSRLESSRREVLDDFATIIADKSQKEYEENSEFRKAVRENMTLTNNLIEQLINHVGNLSTAITVTPTVIETSQQLREISLKNTIMNRMESIKLSQDDRTTALEKLIKANTEKSNHDQDILRKRISSLGNRLNLHEKIISDEINSKFDDLGSCFEALRSEMNDIRTIDEKIGLIRGQLVEMKSSIVTDTIAIKESSSKLNEINSDIKQSINNQISKVQDIFNNATSEFKEHISTARTTTTTAVDGLDSKLEQHLAGLKTDSNILIKCLETVLTNHLSVLDKTSDGLVETLEKKLSDHVITTENKMNELVSGLDSKLNGHLGDLRDDNRMSFGRAEKKLDSCVATVNKKLQSSISTLSDETNTLVACVDGKTSTLLEGLNGENQTHLANIKIELKDHVSTLEDMLHGCLTSMNTKANTLIEEIDSKLATRFIEITTNSESLVQNIDIKLGNQVSKMEGLRNETVKQLDTRLSTHITELRNCSEESSSNFSMQLTRELEDYKITNNSLIETLNEKAAGLMLYVDANVSTLVNNLDTKLTGHIATLDNRCVFFGRTFDTKFTNQIWKFNTTTNKLINGIDEKLDDHLANVSTYSNSFSVNLDKKLVNHVNALESQKQTMFNEFDDKLQTHLSNLHTHTHNFIGNMDDKLTTSFSNLDKNANTIVTELKAKLINHLLELEKSTNDAVNGAQVKTVKILDDAKLRLNEQNSRVEEVSSALIETTTKTNASVSEAFTYLSDLRDEVVKTREQLSHLATTTSEVIETTKGEMNLTAESFTRAINHGNDVIQDGFSKVVSGYTEMTSLLNGMREEFNAKITRVDEATQALIKLNSDNTARYDTSSSRLEAGLLSFTAFYTKAQLHLVADILRFTTTTDNLIRSNEIIIAFNEGFEIKLCEKLNESIAGIVISFGMVLENKILASTKAVEVDFSRAIREVNKFGKNLSRDINRVTGDVTVYIDEHYQVFKEEQQKDRERCLSFFQDMETWGSLEGQDRIHGVNTIMDTLKAGFSTGVKKFEDRLTDIYRLIEKISNDGGGSQSMEEISKGIFERMMKFHSDILKSGNISVRETNQEDEGIHDERPSVMSRDADHDDEDVPEEEVDGLEDILHVSNRRREMVQEDVRMASEDADFPGSPMHSPRNSIEPERLAPVIIDIGYAWSKKSGKPRLQSIPGNLPQSVKDLIMEKDKIMTVAISHRKKNQKKNVDGPVHCWRSQVQNLGEGWEDPDKECRNCVNARENGEEDVVCFIFDTLKVIKVFTSL